ncbi:hypothetical protein D4764_09G0000990 [Takifugu flavidus]|uniref:Uncharacterized protein n=1 Tax=Takifugu flavidus TaxID=433684 RepID=A0A5C6MNT3_9TELE|nr:hypothetical protein D4764_09G0000990 [Takifugu flavidus]
MRGQQSGCSEDVKEMLLLLLSYFDEKEESMFFHSLAYVSEFVMYMLSLDRNLVNTNISSFISALWLMFGSYYCFNIHYPSELASTLEFLQSGVEEPLISHGWRRMQTHLRALFISTVSMSSAGPANVHRSCGRHRDLDRAGKTPRTQRQSSWTAGISGVRFCTFTDPADDMETSNKQGR